MARILLWSSAVRVHDSQAYRKMDVQNSAVQNSVQIFSTSALDSAMEKEKRQSHKQRGQFVYHCKFCKPIDTLSFILSQSPYTPPPPSRSSLK